MICARGSTGICRAAGCNSKSGYCRRTQSRAGSEGSANRGRTREKPLGHPVHHHVEKAPEAASENENEHLLRREGKNIDHCHSFAASRAAPDSTFSEYLQDGLGQTSLAPAFPPCFSTSTLEPHRGHDRETGRPEKTILHAG